MNTRTVTFEIVRFNFYYRKEYACIITNEIMLQLGYNQTKQCSLTCIAAVFRSRY